MMKSENQNQQRYRDPFAEEPLPKAFYYPTQQKELSQSQKRIALSPSRAQSKNGGQSQKLDITDQLFLKGANTFSTNTTPPELDHDVSSKFDESWPSSERPSSVSMLDHEDKSPSAGDLSKNYSSYLERFSDLKKTLEFSENESQMNIKQRNTTTDRLEDLSNQKDTSSKTSVLGRYIERFRKGDPMSREERQRVTDPKDFWWLGQRERDGDSLTAKDERTSSRTKKTQRLTQDSLASLSDVRSDQRKTVNMKAVPPSPSEERTRKLQERAEKLLEKSVSSLASTDRDFEVSTDGLGSSAGETTIGSVEEQPYRPKFVKNLGRENIPQFNLGVPISMVTKPACPEQDILYQWRIKRKMEQAKERTVQLNVTPAINSFVPKSQTMSDVEKKLEEFKQKLAEGRLGIPLPQQTSNAKVSFTPAPRQPDFYLSDRKERKEKDTDRERQDNLSDVLECDPPDLERHYPTIASPTLKRKGKPSDKDIEPHLHLMCDLLPCPHQSNFSKHLNRMVHKTDSDESLKESQSETYKYLEAERPDVEKQTRDRGPGPCHTDSRTEGKVQEEVTSEVKGHTTEVRRKIDYSEEDNKEKFLKSKSDSRRRRKDEQTCDSGEENLSSRSEDDLSSKKSHRKREQTRGRQVEDQEKGYVPGPRHSQSPRSGSEEKRHIPAPGQSQSPRSRSGEKGYVLGPGRSQSPRSGSGEKGRVPGPGRSQSPRLEKKKTPHVESAIGQVIKDRLFNMSTSTVLSSVDSLPPFASPSASLDQPPSNISPQTAEEDPQRGGRSCRDQSAPPHASLIPDPKTDEDAEYESDEEFADDQILQMLRRQRAQYEEQLRIIDEKLMRIERTNSAGSGR